MKDIGGFSLLVGHVNTGIVEVSWDLVLATRLSLLAPLAKHLPPQLYVVQPVFYWFTSFYFCNFLDIFLRQFLYSCITALHLITLIRLLRNVKVEIGVEMLITQCCSDSVRLFLSFLLQETEHSLQSWRDLHGFLFPSQGSDWDWWLCRVGQEQIILLVSGGVVGRVVKKIIPQSIIYLHSLSGAGGGKGGDVERD